MDGEDIIIRADAGTAMWSGTAPGSVVAYQADTIDHAGLLGWSVTVVGVARPVTDPDAAAAYRRALPAWPHGPQDQVIAIHASLIAGFRMVAPGPGGRPPSGQAWLFALHVRPAAAEAGLRTRILAVAEMDEHLLSALREGLSNAARHASASRVDVSVEAGHELILVVRDNGIGIGGTGRRSGLANLAERAEPLGGTLRTRPAEGGGTELTWRVPLD